MMQLEVNYSHNLCSILLQYFCIILLCTMHLQCFSAFIVTYMYNYSMSCVSPFVWQALVESIEKSSPKVSSFSAVCLEICQELT